MTKLSISSRNAAVDIDTDLLAADIVTKLVNHGVTQKISDAAASALADCGHGKNGDGKTWDDLSEDEQAEVTKAALDAMTKVRDTLLAGEWGVERTGGAGVDPVVAEIRTMLRSDYKKGWIKAHNADAWKALEESEITDGLDALFADQTPEVQAAITDAAKTEIERKRVARLDKKSVVGLIKM